MIRGLYTAASGMTSLQNRQEALSNNLANVNTPGYKQTEGVLRTFPEELILRMNDQDESIVKGYPIPGVTPAPVGRLAHGVYMQEAIPVFSQGDIAQTYSPFDVAFTDNLEIPQDAEEYNNKPIQPKMFISVARMGDPTQAAEDDTIRLTRNSSWNVSEQGYLVTNDGYYLLDRANRPIQINNGTDTLNGTFQVGANGRVTLSNNTNADLNLVSVTNPYQLLREGNNLYRADDPDNVVALGAADEGRYALRQGWQERSNVDPTRTTTDMMMVLRAYEANQRVISTLDGTLEKAANEIGRV
ncbi:flagellar hook-basal body protein [Brevibacillus daliensis]|uniref:flagellar hook-basal body protein n=1 Tax=Brevibacillus daliensis TaxID=2892995 RepID=UPI001E639942|nr:flagellar hook-basal body protein [Brevibacillus daliensis]